MSNFIREKEYELLAAGLQNAYVRDVLDLGVVTSKWEGKERSDNKHRLFFEAEERDSHGRVIYLRRDYTSSFAPMAKLTEHVEAILGRQLTADEKRNFDLDDLIGLPCQLIVVHAVSKTDGRTYANVKDILTWPAKLKPPRVDPAYVRLQDRENNKPPVAAKPAQQPVVERAAAAAQAASVKDGVSTADLPPSEVPPPNTPFAAHDSDCPF